MIADFGLAVVQGGTLSVMMSSVGGASAMGGNRGQYLAVQGARALLFCLNFIYDTSGSSGKKEGKQQKGKEMKKG